MSNNITWHQHAIDKTVRAKQKSQKPLLIWFTGLSGSGKSTLAGALEVALVQQGIHTYLLDGDNVRHGLCGDLGFSDTDRDENLRRVGETAKLMLDAGLIVLAAFVSPCRAHRDGVRALLGAEEFVEVYVNTPVDVCAQRDPKGLYAMQARGELKGLNGVDAPFEAPENPELIIDTSKGSTEQQVAVLVDFLQAKLEDKTCETEFYI